MTNFRAFTSDLVIPSQWVEVTAETYVRPSWLGEFGPDGYQIFIRDRWSNARLRIRYPNHEWLPRYAIYEIENLDSPIWEGDDWEKAQSMMEIDLSLQYGLETQEGA